MPSQPAPIPNDGVRLGAVDGWRLWRCVDGYRLKSVTRDVTWLPGVPMTGDISGAYGSGRGSFNHAGGVYAFREIDTAVRELFMSLRDEVYVLGRVKLWGTIVEHELGYRAENARIVELTDAKTPDALGYGMGELLRTIRTLYLDREVPAHLTPVFDARGEEIRVVGVTLVVPQEDRPVVALDPRFTNLTPFPPTGLAQTIEYRYFRVRKFHLTPDAPYRRGISLEGNEDPSWLPGWLPL